MSSSNLTSKLYEMAEKELTEFENSLDTVKKAIDAAYELSVKRDILSYIENDLPDEITDPDKQTAIENLIETGSPLAIYYDEWLHNEYDNRMEAISMTADDVYSIQQKKLLDLDHNSYCFTVISFDNNDKIAVADYVGKDDPAIYDFDEFIDYAARQNNDEVEVDASFYVVGSSGESDPPDEKQLTYINNHMEEIIREATLLESNTFTVDITEIKKEMEEDAPVYDEKYIFTMVEFETGDTYALPGIIDDNNIKGTAAWREIKNNSFNIDDVQDLDEGIKVTYDVYNADNPEAVVPTEEQLQKIIKNIGDYMLDTHSTNEGYVYAWQDCDDIIFAMKQYWGEIHATAPSISDNFESNNYLFPKEPQVVARFEGKEIYNLDESIEQIKLFGKEWLNVYDAAIEMNRRGVDIKDIEMLNVRCISDKGDYSSKDMTPEMYFVYKTRTEEHTNDFTEVLKSFEAKTTELYKKSFSEARESGEIGLYHKSNKVNQRCANMIDTVASAHYENYNFHATDTLDDIMQRGYSLERIALVVAVNIADKNWDARLSSNNISWANEYLSAFPEEIKDKRSAYYITMHPGLLDMFADVVKEKIEHQKETYSEKIDNVADIADKIADAIDIDNSKIDIEKDKHTTTKQINERM